MKTDEDRIDEALDLLLTYGGIDGAHHKQWTIDQAVRTLAGDQYQNLIDVYCNPDNSSDPDDYYEWDEGIAP